MDNPELPDLLRALSGGKSPDMPKSRITLEELEDRRGSKIIIVKHGIVRSSLINFFDNETCLSRQDATNIMKIMRLVDPNKTLEIILETPGGSMTAAEVIVNCLLNHRGKVIVYVPRFALSAGTLIALAADEIYLEKNAFLGPVDPQFRFGYSAASLLQYTDNISETNASWVTDLAKIVRIEASKSMKWILDIINRIYTYKRRELTDKLFEFLVSGKHNHERPLFFNDLSSIIPFIHEGIPNELYELFENS
jgi:ATP-dependent protease ClpP protease subunit